METCRQCSRPMADDELCGDCRGRLERCRGLLPEHIAGSNAGGEAWLIDPFGRGHPLVASGSIVGRTDTAAVTLLHATVSREHARLWRRNNGRWAIEDLGSKNGTTTGDRTVELEPLDDGAQISFGKVPLWFRLQRGDRIAAPQVSTVLDASSDRLIAALVSPAGLHLELRSTATDAGVALVSPTGEPPWQEMEISAMELALLEALCDRAADPGASSEVQRCVPTRELATLLPFRTDYPDDQNVRQLVRRTRTLLASIGVEKLIGSRPPYGYLITWKPR